NTLRVSTVRPGPARRGGDMSEIQVRPISPVIGAEVDAGDVRKLSPEGREELRQAVFRHQVVILRDQDLSRDELAEVGSWFGTLQDQGHGGLVGELTEVSEFEITPDRPPRADLWHTDLSYWE